MSSKVTEITRVMPGEEDGKWTWIHYIKVDKDGAKSEKKSAIKEESLIKTFCTNGPGQYELTWEKDGEYYAITAAKFVEKSSNSIGPGKEKATGFTNKDLQIEAAVIFKGAVELSGQTYRKDTFRATLASLAQDYKDLLSGKLLDAPKEEVPF